MSLSMQTIRGGLALSLLLLLGLLAALTRQHPQERVGALPVVASVAACEVSLPHAPALRFAQTPADLGPLAKRWDSCRA